MGFGTHPHNNMEIITIPLQGALAHKDSMGNGTTIFAGDVQVMSAGTGIQHSEFNANENEICNLLQIWLFPNKKNVEPRYQQITLDVEAMQNNFLQILSPNPEDEGVWIHQNAWFYMGNFEALQKTNYRLKSKENGVYLFVISGEIKLNEAVLEQRDAIAVFDCEEFQIEINQDAKILIMDIPLEIN
jgi:redox-sensitive bicupin YhaK (pirin superfamily)